MDEKKSVTVLNIVTFIVLAFGFLIAFLGGVFSPFLERDVVGLLFVVIGGLVGVFYGVTLLYASTHKVIVSFVVMVSLMLVVVADVQMIPGIGPFLDTIHQNIANFVASLIIPAGLIVLGKYTLFD